MPDTSSGSSGSRGGSTPSPTRVLFLAVDAGDWDPIRGWSDEGWLPTFRSLRETAAWGVTSNPTGLFVGAVWPSFWTGLSPARHGRYCFEQIRTGSYDLYRVTPRDTSGVPFWDTLSDAGRRVAVIDVPKTYPSSRIRGVQIVDWGTHDPDLGFSPLPRELGSPQDATHERLSRVEVHERPQVAREPLAEDLEVLRLHASLQRPAWTALLVLQVCRGRSRSGRAAHPQGADRDRPPPTTRAPLPAAYPSNPTASPPRPSSVRQVGRYATLTGQGNV